MQGMDREAAVQMLEQAQMPNIVQALVEEQQLQRRNAQRWAILNNHHVLDFPRLSFNDLKDITVGVYQVGLAPGYVQDKLQRQDNDEYQLKLLRDEDRLPEPGFLRVRLFSRFRNSTQYQVWVAYRSVDEQPEEDNASAILGYYCTCPSGARTLGTCAHVASLFWFLGYARHEEYVHFPPTTLMAAVLDSANRPIPQPLNISIVNP